MIDINMIKKILRYPEKITADKRLHYMLGAWFSLLEVLGLLIVGISMYTILLSLFVLVLFSYLIEFYQDMTKSGAFEHYDALAVFLGGLNVLIPLMLIVGAIR